MPARHRVVAGVEQLPGRAVIGVGCWIVAKPLFGKEAVADVDAPVRAGNVRRDAGGFARLDIFALVVAHVGNRIDLLDAEQFLCSTGGGRQQAHVVARVRDVLLDDEAVLSIDCHLRVVADGHLAMGDHRARIGVGKRDLPFATLLQLTEQRRTDLTLLAQFGDLRRQSVGAAGAGTIFAAVDLVQLGQVAL